MEQNSTGAIMNLNGTDIDSLQSGRFYILGISWVSDDSSAIATDNDFELTDEAGILIASKRAEADGDDYGKSFCAPLPVDGIKLTKLDGGICQVYLKTL